MRTTWDGHPRQGMLHDVHLTGRYAQFSFAGLSEMVVVAVHPVDDPENRSGKYVEYSLRDIHTGEIIHGARRAGRRSGPDDGDEVVLRPATKNYSPGKSLDAFTPAREHDGDRVLVGFIGGSRRRPVILGTTPHESQSYGSTKLDGARDFSTLGGTSIERRADGSVLILRTVEPGLDTSILIGKDGNVVISHYGGAEVRLEQGVVTIDGQDIAGVNLGAGATQSAVRGDSYRAAEATMNAVLMTAVPAAISAIGGAAPYGSPAQLGAAFGGIVTLLTAWLAQLSTFEGGAVNYVSTKVKVE